MTIQLKDARWIDGVLQAAGAIVLTNDQLERQLVSDGVAEYIVPPVVDLGQNGGVSVERSERIALLVGDSLAAHNNVSFGVSSITVANGVATLVTSANHNLSTGSVGTVYGVTTPTELNGPKQFMRVNNTTLKFPTTCPDGSAALSGGSITNHARLLESSWLAWGNSYAGGRIMRFINFGGAGWTAQQSLDSLDKMDSLAASAGVVFVIVGINDFIGGSPKTSATVCATLKKIFDTVIASGRKVVSLGLLPLGNGHASYNSGVMTKIKETNRFCSRYASVNANARYANCFGALTNSADALGAAAANYLRSDNIHLSAAGARRLGELVISPIIKELVSADSVLAESQGDTTNLAPNPMLTGSGGAVSGTNVSGSVPTSWQGRLTAGTVTSCLWSIQARADGFGNNAVATIAGASNGAEISFNSTAAISGVSPGDTVQTAASVSLSGAADVSKLRFFASLNFDGNAQDIEVFATVPTTYSNTDMEIPIVSQPFKIPDDVSLSSFSLQCRLGFGGAGTGAAVLAVGRPTIRNRTKESLGLMFD